MYKGVCVCVCVCVRVRVSVCWGGGLRHFADFIIFHGNESIWSL